MVARKKLTMSEDKKKENPKTVYRFDNEDWIVPPSRDQIKKNVSFKGDTLCMTITQKNTSLT